MGGDSVDKFISDHVRRDPETPRISTEDVYAWCRENGEDPVGQQQFTNKLKQEDVGYKTSLRITGGNSTRGYEALGFSKDVPANENLDEDGRQFAF